MAKVKYGVKGGCSRVDLGRGPARHLRWDNPTECSGPPHLLGPVGFGRSERGL